jgi:hypothetical protein
MLSRDLMNEALTPEEKRAWSAWRVTHPEDRAQASGFGQALRVHKRCNIRKKADALHRDLAPSRISDCCRLVLRICLPLVCRRLRHEPLRAGMPYLVSRSVYLSSQSVELLRRWLLNPSARLLTAQRPVQPVHALQRMNPLVPLSTKDSTTSQQCF